MNNQHHACILESNYCLGVFNVHFKYRVKMSFLIDPVLSLHTKTSEKPTIPLGATIEK